MDDKLDKKLKFDKYKDIKIIKASKENQSVIDGYKFNRIDGENLTWPLHLPTH